MSSLKNCCCGGGRICPSHGDTTPHEREEGTLLVRHLQSDHLQSPLFKLNDKVEKFTGDYQLSGIVVAIFYTTKGKLRYVVEHEPGFLHIYNEGQLRLK